jgi:hypothetical protein
MSLVARGRRIVRRRNPGRLDLMRSRRLRFQE